MTNARIMGKYVPGSFYTNYSNIGKNGEFKMYKDLEKFKFHCFADNRDDYSRTKKATDEMIEDWKLEGVENIRIYTCKWNKTEDIYDDVDCIYSFGSFPI